MSDFNWTDDQIKRLADQFYMGILQLSPHLQHVAFEAALRQMREDCTTQIAALTAERDELLRQLDAATQWQPVADGFVHTDNTGAQIEFGHGSDWHWLCITGGPDDEWDVHTVELPDDLRLFRCTPAPAQNMP